MKDIDKMWNVTFWLVFWCIVVTGSVWSLVGMIPAVIIEFTSGEGDN